MPTTEQKQARDKARAALGPRYTQRLLACYAVLVDGEGLIAEFGRGNIQSAHRDVCEALCNLRKEGDIDF